MLEKLVGGLISGRSHAEGDPTVIVECRQCGTSLDESDDGCPYCGKSETVRFEI